MRRALAFAAVLGLVACGGGSVTGRATWIRKMDRLCASSNAQIRSVNAQAESGRAATGWDAVVSNYARFEHGSETMLEAARKLRAPDDGTATARRLVDLLELGHAALVDQERAAQVRDLAAFFTAGNRGLDAFVPFILTAREYGMRDCAQSVALAAGATDAAFAVARGALGATWWCNIHAGRLRPPARGLAVDAAHELIRAAGAEPRAMLPYSARPPTTFRRALVLLERTLRSCREGGAAAAAIDREARVTLARTGG